MATCVCGTKSGLYQITRDDINKIKKCKSVSFVTVPGSPPETGPVSRMTMWMKAPSIPSEDDKHIIACGWRFDDYSRGDDSRMPAPIEHHAHCHTNVSNSEYACANPLTGLAAVLKPGDSVVLYWVRNNNTENLRTANMCADELHAVVCRGDREIVVSMGYRVGPDNSARWIRTRAW